MFWGLIMEPKRRYTQVVKRPFHISMAALDIFSADEEPTQVMLYFEGRNYLLCTLQKGQMLQCPLDLNFEMGDEVVFATNGNSNIHLSGYIQEQLDELLEEEEAEDEEEVEQEQPLKDAKSKKKKPGDKLTAKQPPTKKSKLADLLKDDYSSNDEDESYVASEMAEDEGEEEEEEDDDDDDDDDLDEEDEVEEDKSDVSSLSEEEMKKPTKQMNGDKAKSQKKRKSINIAEVETTKNEKKTKTEKTPSKANKTDGPQKNIKNSGFTESPTQQNKKTLEGGVIIQDLKVGDGTVARPGKMLQVYYEGRLKQNNKIFDQTTKGAGFKFRLGKQEVIKAWDVGVVGMKIGGRRRIICPAAMAYGQKGSPPAIPPNSALVFDVELKNVI